MAEGALRETAYTISQTPDLLGTNGGVPTISHDALNRTDLKPRWICGRRLWERDFALIRWNREIAPCDRTGDHYRYVGGIGSQAQRVLLMDTTDIATNTNEVGYSLTQRFYLRPAGGQSCASTDDKTASKDCQQTQPREWASWQVAQKFYIDSSFGGALISDRRNVFDATLDLSGAAFLTGPRNLSPVTSRLRFEAIDNLRIQWDLDYDPKAGLFGADNMYAGLQLGPHYRRRRPRHAQRCR